MSDLAVHDPSFVQALGLGFGVLAGVMLGAAYFGALGWTVRCFAAGFALQAILLQIGRMALMATALAGLAQLGAGPLIAGLLGLLLARQGVLRRPRGAP